MPYSTPTDVRLRAVGMTEEVIPDVSSTSLNLTTCIAEADAEIDEAARAGDYEVPFAPVPERVHDLSAIGALARARRGLQLGNQPAAEPDPYRAEFEAGLALLRRGGLDLGTVVVSGEQIVLPTDDGDWAQLAHRGILEGSVSLTNESASFTYVEDRRAYQPDYRPDAIKDYVVDHRTGRLRRLLEGRIAPGQTVLAGYEYYRRQPGRAQDAEYAGRTASADELLRLDHRD
jgi:hypothetical protein